MVYFVVKDADFFLYAQTMYNAHGCASNCGICPGGHNVAYKSLVIVLFVGFPCL